jgi:murein DD-endopeptidase MepM/ murein hydrolase activator NlpD
LVKVHLGTARASSLQPARIVPLLFAGIAAFCIGTAGHNFSSGSYFIPAIAPDVVAAAAPVVAEIAESEPVRAAMTAANDVQDEVREIAQSVAPKPEIVTREVELGKGKTFAGMLEDADVAPGDALAAAAALNEVFSHRLLKAGQEMTLTFSRLGNEETLTNVTFQPEAVKEVVIARTGEDGFVGEVNVTPFERERFAVRGEIRTSLYEAGAREGVPSSVMAALLRVYAHAVDFQRDIRSGDRFEVLYDQPITKDGKPAGHGVIIYAALEIGGKTMPLYRVTFADGAVDYFDASGQSIKRALLRTPLHGARVTSGYGMRRHPILGYSKMHRGTDFGAATGTPIFAAGAGTIVEVGPNGAYGRFIKIRHNGKIETAYAHMSRFARGMHKGARVDQGDVIGFVGSTGRSTGPHLHFEVRVNNRQVNPQSVNTPSGRVLKGKLLAQFKTGKTKIQNEFASLLTRDSGTAVAQAPKPAEGIVKASTTAPAFNGNKPTNACGLRGGC